MAPELYDVAADMVDVVHVTAGVIALLLLGLVAAVLTLATIDAGGGSR